MKEFWDERYDSIAYAYGKKPNEFFKEQLNKLEKGKILLPADGEGRNSVYAAKLGWDVHACDLSSSGKDKAEKLAKEVNVSIRYLVGDFGDLIYSDSQFDAIALIYAHFPAERKNAFHKLVNRYLKVGGFIIFEAFSKNHIKFNSQNSNVGGPKDVEMLYSIEEVNKDFSKYEILILEEIETDLNEGKYHIGRGSVVRFVGRKFV
jgi:ubiquinone/menaquinone biosynthesis C-methylase UbiE